MNISYLIVLVSLIASAASMPAYSNYMRSQPQMGFNNVPVQFQPQSQFRPQMQMSHNWLQPQGAFNMQPQRGQQFMGYPQQLQYNPPMNW